MSALPTYIGVALLFGVLVVLVSVLIPSEGWVSVDVYTRESNENYQKIGVLTAGLKNWKLTLTGGGVVEGSLRVPDNQVMHAEVYEGSKIIYGFGISGILMLGASIIAFFVGSVQKSSRGWIRPLSLIAVLVSGVLLIVDVGSVLYTKRMALD